jgi:hypothetical protein
MLEHYLLLAGDFMDRYFGLVDAWQSMSLSWGFLFSESKFFLLCDLFRAFLFEKCIFHYSYVT